MASASVVVGQPGVKGEGSGGVAGVGLPVGPFGGQGPVEPLDLPVLPGAVGLDEDVGGTQAGHRVGERTAVPVGERVVGDDLLDPCDAVRGEVLAGAGQERRAGRALLVGVDLAVGQAGVVVVELEDDDLASAGEYVLGGVQLPADVGAG